MAKITLKTQIEITDHQAHDVMTTAIEGGIGYWAIASDIETIQAPGADFIDGYKRFVIRENEEYAEHGDAAQSFVVDADVIREGIKKLHGLIGTDVHPGSEIGVQFLHHLFSTDEGIEYVDSVVADAIVQAAVFGEIRYG